MSSIQTNNPNGKQVMGMAQKINAGEYQIGIYYIQRVGRQKWVATATGPGTLGDGSPRTFKTFRDAYRSITGESLS